MKTKAVLIHGKDEYGRFVMGAGNCIYCNAQGIACIKYAPKSFELPLYHDVPLDVESTILGSTRNKIGITCGCYAKLHRQVTHITDQPERW